MEGLGWWREARGGEGVVGPQRASFDSGSGDWAACWRMRGYRIDRPARRRRRRRRRVASRGRRQTVRVRRDAAVLRPWARRRGWWACSRAAHFPAVSHHSSVGDPPEKSNSHTLRDTLKKILHQTNTFFH